MTAKSDAPARPFRIWDSQGKHFVVGRSYKYLRNAHNGALIGVRWSDVDTSWEILDVSHGSKCMGVYTLTPTSVRYTKVIDKGAGK